LWKPLRERVAAELDAVGDFAPHLHALWLGIIYLGIWSFFFFMKYCQYRGFQLPGDTAATLSMAYNVLHGLGFENSMYGVNNFAIHFQPIIVLYAPFLLFSHGTLLLLAAQCAIFCSAPIAVYILVLNRTRSAAAAMAGLWICLSSPFIFHAASNNLETHVNLAAFFLWTMVFAERRRWLAAGAFFLLAAMSNEHSMFAFFGVGLYLLLRRPAQPNDRAWGAAVCAGTAALFLLEMLVIYSFPAAERLRNWPLMYGHLGASPAAAVASAFSHPLHFLMITGWPLSKLEPLWRVLWTTGFFCLLSPAALIAWFVNYLPCLFATPGTAMQQLTLHYAAQVTGPIWWATALGFSMAFQWLAARKQTSLLLLCAVCIGGINVYHTPSIMIPNWSSYYFNEGPIVTAIVPSDAAVWAPEFLTPWLGARGRIKSIGVIDDGALLKHGFMPDYVILDRGWFQIAASGLREKFTTLFRRESYAPVLNTANYIVFKHPRYPLARDVKLMSFEPPQQIDEGPRVADAVPRDGAVWAPAFLVPWFGVRDRIKPLLYIDDGTLQKDGFMPDYVVIDHDWLRSSEINFRKKVATLFRQEGYTMVLKSSNYIVFGHPHYPLPRAASFRLPEAKIDFEKTLAFDVKK
jgi:uncharacterized membrane protein